MPWAKSYSKNLIACYTPGPQNVVADQLSHQGQVLSTEWSHHLLFARGIFQVWRTPVVDLFTSAQQESNGALFLSSLPVMAWQEDTFLVPWSNLDAYPFPPFSLIQGVINRLLRSQCFRMTGNPMLATPLSGSQIC